MGVILGLLIAAFAGFFVGITQWATARITGIQLPAGPIDPASIGLDLDLLNSFVPLAEGMVILYVVLAIWISVIVVRWVKSFIPTLSN